MAGANAEPYREARGPGAAFGIVALGLLAFFLVPLLVDAYRLPVGADVPYYVWATRLAGHVGLSVTDFRPGLHALLLLLSGATGLSVLRVTQAATVALAVSTGLAAAVLAERGLGRDRLRSAAVGIVTGAYTARLASGFLANLLFAALFLACVAALLGGRRRASAVLAALMLGAAGLAHGLFLLLGAAILGGTALLRLAGRRASPGARDDLSRLGAAAVGGAAIAGTGFLFASLGRPLSSEERLHTRDALLQSAELARTVGQAYRSRWAEALRAFVLPVSLPLAGIGGAVLRAVPAGVAPLFAAFLVSWAGATVVGVGAGLATSRLPAARILNFALVLPFVAALGAVAAGRWAGRRDGRVGAALGLVLLVALLAGPFRAWDGTHPFTSRVDLQAAGAAGAYAARLPERTPLVYLIDHSGPHAGFEMSRYINAIRMGLPSERSADALFFVGGADDYSLGRPDLDGDAEHDAIARDAFAQIEPVLAAPHVAFLLRPFNQAGWDSGVGLSLDPIARVIPDRTEAATDPIRPGAEAPPSHAGVAPWLLPFLTIGVLAILAVVGIGWVRGLMPHIEGPEAWALAPGVGAGILVLFGVAADALGLHLASWGGLAAVAAFVGGLLVRRRSRSRV